MSAQPKRITTGAEWFALQQTVHPSALICPGCKQSVETSPLLQLVYSFEKCSAAETGCTKPAFTHTAERAWHRWCFVKANTREKQ